MRNCFPYRDTFLQMIWVRFKLDSSGPVLVCLATPGFGILYSRLDISSGYGISSSAALAVYLEMEAPLAADWALNTHILSIFLIHNEPRRVQIILPSSSSGVLSQPYI